MKDFKLMSDRLQELYNKCHKSNDFKLSLVNEPLQTLESFFDSKMNILKDERIYVEDQSDQSKVYLNIPRRLDVDDLELDDEQLEAVAGGDIFVGILIGATVYFLARSAGQEFGMK